MYIIYQKLLTCNEVIPWFFRVVSIKLLLFEVLIWQDIRIFQNLSNVSSCNSKLSLKDCGIPSEGRYGNCCNWDRNSDFVIIISSINGKVVIVVVSIVVVVEENIVAQ